MSHLLDELLAQAANGSPITAALSSESVAVLFFASEFLGERPNWLDKGVDPLDEVTDADWDEIEKLVGNVYEELMTPIDITPIGALAMWAATAAPTKWLLCQGQSLLRSAYADLFAVLGTTYGAADSTHFTLPDLRGRSPMMPGSGVVTALAQAAGADAVSLAISNLPSHDHDFAQTAHTHLLTDPGHVHQEKVSTGVAASVFTTGGGGNSSVGSAATVGSAPLNTVQAGTGIGVQTASANITFHAQGSNSPHANLHPVLGVNFIIYAGV